MVRSIGQIVEELSKGTGTPITKEEWTAFQHDASSEISEELAALRIKSISDFTRAMNDPTPVR